MVSLIIEYDGGPGDETEVAIWDLVGRGPDGAGTMLETGRRDLEYAFRTFPDADRAAKRVARLLRELPGIDPYVYVRKIYE